MSFHPLEKFGVVGLVVAVLVVDESWPAWLTSMIVSTVAGALLMIGQSRRHREILRRLR